MIDTVELYYVRERTQKVANDYDIPEVASSLYFALCADVDRPLHATMTSIVHTCTEFL